MNKILSVLLAMTMLFSVMFTLGVSADGNTIVVTQATMDMSGDVTVCGTFAGSGAVTILATAQEAAGNKAALGTMADGSTIAYVDQKTPNANGEFVFKFNPRVEGTYTTIYVCAAGVTAEKMFAENLTGNDVTVIYDGTLTDTVQSDAGVVTIKLRPCSDQKTGTKKIATQRGYFKQWNIMGVGYNTEGTNKTQTISGIQNGIITATSEVFATPHTSISAARAQKVKLASGDDAIRFLALVGADYEDYASAGFVLSTLGENPTVEAGYKAHAFNSLFTKIVSGSNQYDVSDSAFKGKFGTFTLVPTGILYANLVIDEANKGTTYYATPYLEDTQGNRVYGETKAITFNELAEFDGIEE